MELHEWAVWIADPNVELVNAKDRYVSALPSIVSSVRSREVARGEERLSPLTMLTFYGEPVADLEVSIQAKSGQFVAHWPASEVKNRRLRWPELSLAAEEGEKARLAPVADDHWFQQARKLDSLWVSLGARTERFLAYDVEIKFPIPLRIEGGPDRYNLTNTSSTPLEDVVVVAPSSEGRRIGWLDRLPPAPAEPVAGKNPAGAAPAEAPAKKESAASTVEATTPTKVAPQEGERPPEKSDTKPTAQEAKPPEPSRSVEVIMSDPLAADGDEVESATTGTLKERLLRAGLRAGEVDLLLSLYSKSIFESRDMVVLFRLSSDAVAEQLPLDVFPEPQKAVRVALVLARNIDPRTKEEVKSLIAQLGSSKYTEREKAEKRLIELGAIAVPDLKEALKENDLEIVFRVERILLGLNQPIDK